MMAVSTIETAIRFELCRMLFYGNYDHMLPHVSNSSSGFLHVKANIVPPSTLSLKFIAAGLFRSHYLPGVRAASCRVTGGGEGAVCCWPLIRGVIKQRK
jgi:hypothetical protein